MSLDLSYLDKMSGGDLNTKRTMLKIMQQEIAKDLPVLTKLYQARDWDGMARFCHHFKSTIVFSGNQSLIRANRQLWEIAKQKGRKGEGAEQLLKTIQQQGQRVSREVAQLLQELS